MKRALIPILVGANMILLAGVVWFAAQRQTQTAHAQAAASNRFSVVAGTVRGQPGQVLYIYDKTQDLCVATIFNPSSKKFIVIDGTDVGKVFKSGEPKNNKPTRGNR